MKFEFDLAKSEVNRAKHGIDFIEAQKIWKDPGLIDFIPANSAGEHRWYAVGEVNGVLWTATYTERNDAIRIFSVRRSRSEEKEAYYEH